MSKFCDRCGRATRLFAMSYFNTDDVCPECEAIEKAHPDYPEARRAELAAMRSWDLNFPGIGLPAGYEEYSKAMRERLFPTEDRGEE